MIIRWGDDVEKSISYLENNRQVNAYIDTDIEILISINGEWLENTLIAQIAILNKDEKHISFSTDDFILESSEKKRKLAPLKSISQDFSHVEYSELISGTVWRNDVASGFVCFTDEFNGMDLLLTLKIGKNYYQFPFILAT